MRHRELTEMVELYNMLHMDIDEYLDNEDCQCEGLCKCELPLIDELWN